MLRETARALVLLTLFLLSACGDDNDVEPKGVRVLVRTSVSDGPVQGELFLRTTEGDENTIPLRRLDGDMWIADGVEGGYYWVTSTEGWSHLWPSALPPLLSGEADRPNQVWMGRPHSLYLGPQPGQTHEPGLAWTVQRWEGRAGAGAVIPVEAFQQVVPNLPHPHVALRFPAGEWNGKFRALGHLRDGTLCEPVVVSLPIDARGPRLQHVRPARTQPFVATLVRTSPDNPVANGTEVRATVIGLPIEHTYVARSQSELAYFPGVAVAGDGIRVAVGIEERGHVISSKEWRRLGATYLLAPVANPVRVALEGNDPWASASLLIRMDRGDRYGLARVTVKAGQISVDAPIGAQHWLLRWEDASGKPQWGAAKVDVAEGSGMRVRIEDMKRGCSVQGNVVGVPTPGFRLLFFHNEGEDVWVLGHGFDIGVSHTGSFDADLPPGEYRVSILAPDGTERVQKGRVNLKQGVQVRRSWTW